MKIFAAAILILAGSAVGNMMSDNMMHTHSQSNMMNDNMTGSHMASGTMMYGSQSNMMTDNMMMRGSQSNMMTDDNSSTMMYGRHMMGGSSGNMMMHGMSMEYPMPYPKSSMMSQMMQEEMMYVPGSVMSCMTMKCKPKCMSFAEKQMKMMKMSTCNPCLMRMCPMKMGQPSFDRQICTEQAYKTCSITNECQKMSTDDMSKMNMCKMCKNECFPETTKRMVRTKMATAMSCRSKCDTDYSCPEPEPMSCMPCLLQKCSTIGDKYKKLCYTSVRGAGICKMCAIKEPDMAMMGKCKMCKMDCVKDAIPEERRGMPQGMGMNRLYGEFMYLPASSKTCLNTKCSTKCPSNEAMMKKMQNMNENCRMCLMQKCPFKDGMPSFDMEKCHKSAYTMCTTMLKCPVKTMTEKNEQQMCKMCTNDCIPESVKVTVRSAMKSDADCRTQCKTLYNCPEPDPMSCNMCIRKACAQSPSRSCFMTTRTSGACPTCPARQMNMQSMAKCFECSRKCDPVARERMQVASQCSATCKSTYGCPSAPNPQGCQTCIQRYCQRNQNTRCIQIVRQQRLCMDCEPRQQVQRAVLMQCVQCMMKCNPGIRIPGMLPPNGGGASGTPYGTGRPPATIS